MGHRRVRKRERRARQAGFEPRSRDAILDQGSLGLPPMPDFSDLLGMGEDEFFGFAAAEAARARPGTANCGQCHEFIEDQVGGRGTCLHPGSGIAFPWTDTPGCPFFASRGRR